MRIYLVRCDRVERREEKRRQRSEVVRRSTSPIGVRCKCQRSRQCQRNSQNVTGQGGGILDRVGVAGWQGVCWLCWGRRRRADSAQRNIFRGACRRMSPYVAARALCTCPLSAPCVQGSSRRSGWEHSHGVVGEVTAAFARTTLYIALLYVYTTFPSFPQRPPGPSDALSSSRRGLGSLVGLLAAATAPGGGHAHFPPAGRFSLRGKLERSFSESATCQRR